MKRITVITSHYGLAKDLRRCMLSVNKQRATLPYDCELQHIVVIDGTSGKNSRFTEEALKVLPSINGVSLIVSEKNMGKSYQLNRVLENCDSDIIMFLDSDDAFMPNKISRQILFSQHASNAVLGSGYYTYLQDNSFCDKILFPTDPAEIASCFIFYPPMLFSSISASLGSIELLKTHTGRVFDENITAGIDYEFYSRLIQFVDFANIAEPLVAYKVSPNGITRTDKTRLEQLSVHLDSIVNLSSRSSFLSSLNRHLLSTLVFSSSVLPLAFLDELSVNVSKQCIGKLRLELSSLELTDLFGFTVFSSRYHLRLEEIRSRMLLNLCTY